MKICILSSKTNHAALRGNRIQGRLLARRLVGDIVIAAVATPIYGSWLNQSRCKKRKNGIKQRKSLGIFIGEERRVPANGGAQRPEPEWPLGKKDLDSRLSSPGWLPLYPNQPPTAKNLIRCHNYIQWCSTLAWFSSFIPLLILHLSPWILTALSRETAR